MVDAVEWADGRIRATTSDGPATITPFAVALEGAGLRVRSLTLRTPTLDDVFLQLTGSAMGGTGG